MSTPVTRSLDTGEIDVAATLRPLGYWPGDPTTRWTSSSFEKAVRTPDGPGTMRLVWSGRGSTTAEAWGPGAAWLLDRAPDWLGLLDDLEGFDPSLHPRVEEWWRRHPNIRLARGGVVWQELALVLLGQRVTTEEAVRSWAAMCRAWGGPAPGPSELWMPPPPEEIASRSYAELHGLNVERRRADALVLAAKRSGRLEEAATMSATDALTRLSALPGLGAWTATSTVTVSHGDPDVIVLRDYGIPTLVNYAFTGDARRQPPDEGGDELMCEHLAPWAGHRQRIIRLLFTAGVEVPRRAPRARRSDIRRL